MATKDIKELEKTNPVEKLHDIIRNTVTPVIQNRLKAIENTDDIDEILKELDKIEHRVCGIKCGIELVRSLNNNGS